MFTVGVTNQKGGVAKTTDTIHVSAALADRGHDVLAIDADPQGYLTNRLGFDDAYRADKPNFATAMNEPTEHDPHELIEVGEEFDVLPSNVDMFTLVQDLIASGWRPRERLQMLFDRLDGYDYVLVDAPPSLGPINDNVLIATQNILVPVEAEDTSKLALEHLLNQVETIERRYETQINERGIIVSNVDYPLDNEQKAMLEWYRDTFEGRCPTFIVRSRAAIKRAMREGHSVFASDEPCDQKQTFEAIAKELEQYDE